jgi:hypothetical protein
MNVITRDLIEQIKLFSNFTDVFTWKQLYKYLHVVRRIIFGLREPVKPKI